MQHKWVKHLEDWIAEECYLWLYRYYQICDKAIERDMVAPLQEEWIQSMYGYVPENLRKQFPLAADEFLQVGNIYSVAEGLWAISDHGHEPNPEKAGTRLWGFCFSKTSLAPEQHVTNEKHKVTDYSRIYVSNIYIYVTNIYVYVSNIYIC